MFDLEQCKWFFFQIRQAKSRVMRKEKCVTKGVHWYHLLSASNLEVHQMVSHRLYLRQKLCISFAFPVFSYELLNVFLRQIYLHVQSCKCLWLIVYSGGVSSWIPLQMSSLTCTTVYMIKAFTKRHKDTTSSLWRLGDSDQISHAHLQLKK